MPGCCRGGVNSLENLGEHTACQDGACNDFSRGTDSSAPGGSPTPAVDAASSAPGAVGPGPAQLLTLMLILTL